MKRRILVVNLCTIFKASCIICIFVANERLISGKKISQLSNIENKIFPPNCSITIVYIYSPQRQAVFVVVVIFPVSEAKAQIPLQMTHFMRDVSICEPRQYLDEFFFYTRIKCCHTFKRIVNNFVITD